MNAELKLLVASLFATSASFGPFFSLFMQDKGFDALQIGSMISFSRVIMLLSTPAACAYADRRGVHRGLLATLAGMAGVVILTFPLAPKGDLMAVGLIFALYSMCCGSKLAICDTIVLHSCKGMAERYPLQRLWGSIAWGIVAMLIGFFLRWYHRDLRAAGLPITYELVPVIHALFQFCFAAVLMTFIPPTSAPTPQAGADGGGTKGAAVDDGGTEEGTAVTGTGVEDTDQAQLMDAGCDGQINRAIPSVDVAGPLSSLTCGGAAMSVEDGSRGRRSVGGTTGASGPAARFAASPSQATPPTPPSMFAVLRGYTRLSRDRRVLFPVVFGVSILALSEVAMNNFLFPYLRRALKAPPELFSYLLAIHAVSEVIAFTLGSKLMQVLGPRNLLICSSLAFCTKSTWYAILEDPWSLLYVEMLHGVCFALMWTAAVAHVSRIAETVGGPSTASLSGVGVAEDGLATGVADGKHADDGGSHKAKRSTNVRSASMAMTTLWFFANGLPNILGGVLSGYVVQHAETKEVALFQVVGAMSFVVAILFWVYGHAGCFGPPHQYHAATTSE